MKEQSGHLLPLILRYNFCDRIWSFEWLLFNAQWYSFSYIIARTKLFSMIWWWCLFVYYTNSLNWILIVLAQSTDRHALHSDILSWFRTNQSLVLDPNVVCLAWRQHIPLYSLFFDENGDWIRDPPPHTSEYANHYTPNVVCEAFDFELVCT